MQDTRKLASYLTHLPMKPLEYVKENLYLNWRFTIISLKEQYLILRVKCWKRYV
jgi:hypothetical protein